EAQAAEEMRRRDPVKRAMWVGALIIAAMLAWSSSLQLKAILANSELSRIEGEIKSRSDAYKLVLDGQNKIAEIAQKLGALKRLSSSRLLIGTFLDGLQQTSVPDVQLSRLRLTQVFTPVEATKAYTNEHKVLVPAKPAAVVEKTFLTLDGIDSSSNPGDQLDRYKEALATNGYLRQVLVKTNAITLKSLGNPAFSPLSGKRGMPFVFECRYPEKAR
ncbi:MAG: hypothetical protein NT154_36710, partial [Verrucomicrobia bacterium]|nr:hypothetical protein [Verrucomicrobiota bacterium]